MKRFSRLVLVGGLALGACASPESTPLSQETPHDTLNIGTVDSSEDALVFAELDGGSPNIVYGNFRSLAAGDLSEQAFAPALRSAASLLRVNTNSLAFKSAEQDEIGFAHARYQQTQNGLDVVGGELRLHADAQGRVFAVNGSVLTTKVRPEQASISAGDAETLALSTKSGLDTAISQETRLVYIISDDHDGSHLAYEVELSGATTKGPFRDRVYIDAETGALVDTYPQIHFARKRSIYTANNRTSLPGTLKRSEGKGPASAKDINSAYDNLGFVYDYYLQTYGRDSYDGEGAELIATVNFQRDYVNAYWDGEQMVFGDGDGVYASPLAGALDVTAHEMTHAVTSHTAGLVYAGESGGLNEAVSDIFGNTVETWSRGGKITAATWLVGEDIWTPATPNDALRYMDDPAKDGDSLDTYKSYRPGVDVHYSSGIANLAYKLLVTGGKHPRKKTTVEVPALGLEKSAAIFYRALTKYMNSKTNFQGARTATAQAATDLYGADAAAAVHKAWDALQVPGTPTTPGDTPQDASDTVGNGTARSGLSGDKRSATYLQVQVPKGAASLSISTSGGEGDADIYLRYNKQPSTLLKDAASKTNGNDESVTIAAPKAGTYWVMIRGYAAYSGLAIVANY